MYCNTAVGSVGVVIVHCEFIRKVDNNDFW